MADTQLSRFVQDALRAGASRADTESALAKAGWSAEQVRDALSAYAEVDFPVPVPRPRPQLSARDAFMYLVMFGMLYVSAFQLGNLLFQFINMGFPDPLDPMSGQQGFIGRQIRGATSALLVAFPVFLFVASRIARRSDSSRTSSGVPGDRSMNIVLSPPVSCRIPSFMRAATAKHSSIHGHAMCASANRVVG